MNFRPDRAIQISTVFTNPYFYANPDLKEDGTPKWKAYTPNVILDNLYYVCTMKYADSVKGFKKEIRSLNEFIDIIK